jgi:acyl-CoA dehydrogenase family member 9
VPQLRPLHPLGRRHRRGQGEATEQATKWVQTRHQFGRPLSEFELVQERVARMAALTYAMDAMLYMTCGMLDRGDTDIMVETAACKVFCSEQGWNVIDDGMQIMGGEGYMTENEYERIWRDNRIHRIVEGSNEVMQSFVFAYGGKQLAEYMLPLGAQLFLGAKPTAPAIFGLHSALIPQADRLSRMIRRHAHSFKLASKWHREKIVVRQAPQALIADNAVILFALSASLSKMDRQLRAAESGVEFERDRTALEHLFDLLEIEFFRNLDELRCNAHESMRVAADAARVHNDTLPNDRFYIHEASPAARGTGRTVPTEHIKQFPGDRHVDATGDGASGTPPRSTVRS